MRSLVLSLGTGNLLSFTSYLLVSAVNPPYLYIEILNLLKGWQHFPRNLISFVCICVASLPRHMWDFYWASLRCYFKISIFPDSTLERSGENRCRIVFNYLNILILIDEKNDDEPLALTCCISLLGIKMSVFKLC